MARSKFKVQGARRVVESSQRLLQSSVYCVQVMFMLPCSEPNPDHKTVRLRDYPKPAYLRLMSVWGGMRPNRLIIAVFSVIWLLILWLLIEFITEDRKLSEGLSRDMEDTAKQLALCREPSPQMAHKTLKICSPGFILQHAKCVKCPRGTFGLPQWTVCESVLTCDDILHEVRISKPLHTLGNWHYYQAEWKGYEGTFF